MPIDASWQRGRHHPAIRRLPALTAEIGDMRTHHQILNHEAGVALEARPGRGVSLDDLFLVDRQLRLGAAALVASLTGGLVRLRLCPFSMPLGLIFGRRGPPFSRAISSACAAFVRRNSATCSNRATTKFLSSVCERSSKFAGGTIPRMNPTRRTKGIL